MTPDEARASYRLARDEYTGEAVKLRRYSGSGNNRVATDYSLTAVRVFSKVMADELVAGQVQRDRTIILLSEDVDGTGFPLPFDVNRDKVVIGTRELAMKNVDDNSRKVGGELIAYEITAGG